MKISKLFHWLYACLMLLPIAVFIPTAFYYGFNEQAQAQTRTENVPIQVNFNQAIYNGAPLPVNNSFYFYDFSDYTQIYSINENDSAYEININLTESDNIFGFNGKNDYYGTYCKYLVKFTAEIDSNLTMEIMFNGSDTSYIQNLTNSVEYEDYYFFFELNGYNEYVFDNILFYYTTEFVDIYIRNLQLFNLTQMFGEGNEINDINTFNNYFELDYYSYTYSSEEIIYSDIPTTYTMSITDSMSTAWTNTWSNPLFSWSADSFLATPFNYISDLFSIPQNSTFTMALSYWCAISVIYLVFDVIMYVPLLCHRWIDKAKIE